MSSERPFRILDLPYDVLPTAVEKFHEFGSTLTSRELGYIKTIAMSVCRNKTLYEIYCEFLKTNVTEVDALSPFDSLGWNTYDRNPLEWEVFRLNSCIELDSEENRDIRISFSKLLQFIIRHASKNLKVIKMPFIPGEQDDILQCLIENCPNLTEINVTDRAHTHASDCIAQLVGNCTHLEKFTCHYPQEAVLRSLSACDTRLKSLELSYFECEHLNALMDAVETHRLSLRCLVINRMGFTSIADDSYVNSHEMAVQVDEMLNLFLTSENGVHLPVLNYLKFSSLGFDAHGEREAFCLRNEESLQTRYEQQAQVEIDAFGNGTTRYGSVSVRDLRMNDLIRAFDALSKAGAGHWDGLNADGEVFEGNELDIMDELFEELQDVDHDMSDDEDADFGNVNVDNWTKLFCTRDNYSNLRSVTMDVSVCVPLFYKSSTFRKRVRDIWKKAGGTLKYVDCNDHWMSSNCCVSYRQLCGFVRCCVLYCTHITHVRLPSLLIEDMGVSQHTGVVAERCMFGEIVQLLANMKYVQISVPFEGAQYMSRLRAFLFNWPRFLDTVSEHSKMVECICFVIPNTDAPSICEHITDALKVAVNGTRAFQTQHRHVDVSAILQQFDHWYERCEKE